jgi:hypothetical protein
MRGTDATARSGNLIDSEWTGVSRTGPQYPTTCASIRSMELSHQEGCTVTTPSPAKRQLRFGYFFVPAVASPLIATAQRIERLGLDYVGIQNHPCQRNFAYT